MVNFLLYIGPHQKRLTLSVPLSLLPSISSTFFLGIFVDQFSGVNFANNIFYLVILTLSPTLNLGDLGFVSMSSFKAELSASIGILPIKR